VEYWLQLATTPQHYGGVRWWFRCPLVVDAEACAQRVRKLYLPPGEKYFGCRHCYTLTYERRRDRWATSTRAWPAVTIQHTDAADARILRGGRRLTKTRQEGSEGLSSGQTAHTPRARHTPEWSSPLSAQQ
jgi:hypothetical protein